MDEAHLMAAVRYVERNPLEAGMVDKPSDYPWSSAPSHVHGTADPLLSPLFLQDQISDWSAYLADPNDPETDSLLERHIRTGRPLGSPAFVKRLEKRLGRILQPKSAGRPRKN